ncbi:RICIN domain-containing protein [Streptomyces sp. NRRL S-337]|uniref:RICIN domain-containing protein n=1 Tax=Streptomyces sp. NRRL S-337 TaxID=1463900 RepID=UPI0004C91E33|nr:RICIN domain-containing protein [Streptomyces sp. NRRL S-337]
MLLKRLAAVGAGIALVVGLSSTPANAIPRTTGFRNQATDKPCLDFRADYGPYVFNCNRTDYQRWHWDDDYEYTALRQVATKLCLTLRNDRLTMKPCAAADQAAQWQIDETEPVLIRNSVSHKCLARMANDRVSTAPCTGGKSQRWTLR